MALVPGNPGGSPGGHYHTFFDDGNRYDPSKEMYALYALGGSLVIGGPVLGKIARPAAGLAIRQGQKAIWKTMGSFRNPWVAYETAGEISDLAEALELGLTVIDIVEGSSSHGLVQNGGPPAPLQVSSTNADILSLGKISRPTPSSSAQRVIDSKSRKGRRKRCPPGHYWDPEAKGCIPNWMTGGLLSEKRKYLRKR